MVLQQSIRWLMACLFFIWCVTSQASTQTRSGHVVLGSWLSDVYATNNQQRIENKLGIQSSVSIAIVQGRSFYRVLSPRLDENEARQMIEQSKAMGIAGAWFQPLPPSGNPATAVQTNVVVGKSPRVSSTSSSPEQVPIEADFVPQSVPAKQILSELPQVQIASRAADGAIPVEFIADADITLDGHVNESVWQQVAVHSDMRVIDPDSLSTPDHATRTRMFFTNKGLYVAAEMDQPVETLVARLSSRDRFINRDAYGITIDTSGEGLYGYWFKVNLGGSLMDGKVIPERTFDAQWDGPWWGESQRTAYGWSVEMFLPWSMMALPKARGDRRIGVWVDRKVAHTDEVYGWPALPFTGPQFMSALQPLLLPNLQTKSQLAVFPFVSATHDAITDDDEIQVGADIAWRPTPNSQLTATLNPDFGSIESDDVVVNLTAIETFFPEKRLFFLEGTEVFITTPRSDLRRFGNTRQQGSGARATPTTFSPEPTTLLNTRRIGGPPRHLRVPDGIAIDPVERGKPTDLLGAVKSTGSIGRVRYGVLGAFEDDVELPGRVIATGESIKVTEQGRDFGVVRALYESSGESRRSIGYMGTLVTLPDEDSIAHAIDGHYLSAKGRVKFDAQIMATQAGGQDGYGALMDMTFAQRRGLTHFISMDFLDDQFNVSDLGFIRQNDIFAGQYGIVRTAGGQANDRFRYIRNSLFLSVQTNTNGFLNRMGIYNNHTFLRQDNSQFRFEIDYIPSQWDDINSRGNGMFKTDGHWFTQIAYGSDSSKKFSWSGTLGAQQEELNGAWTYSSDIGFTYTPADNISLDLDLSFKKRDGWLLYRSGRNLTTYRAENFQPRLSLDYFISARQQLRLTMQWAGIRAQAQDYWAIPVSEGELVERVQTNGINEDFSLSRLTAQLRYRWEIGPLSDLFVVYTRGSNQLLSNSDSEFGSLFANAIDDPIIDFVVIKLRYRFGT